MGAMQTILRFQVRTTWRRFVWSVASCWTAVALAAPGPSLPKGAWHAPVHAALQAAIERHAGDPDAYAVFDFDMTCPIGDCGHCTLDQIIREISFAFTPDEAEKVFLSDVPNPDIPLDPAYPNATMRNVVLDCADLHRELLEMARVRPLEEVRRTESFTAFASKVRFLRKRVPRVYGTAFGYPWNKRFYNGMTRDRFAELVHRGIDKGGQIGFKRGCWRTPTRYAGRSGVIEVPMLFGFTVPREITELLSVLRANGIAVYAVSGSFYDKVVAAGDARHGTGFAPDEVLGNHIQVDAQGRLTGRADPNYAFPWADGKPDIIRQQLATRHHGRDPIMVFGDSDGDYPMLTAFTNMEVGVIFNTGLPPSSKLGALCAKIMAGQADPRFVLQGRDEVKRTLRPSAETIIAPLVYNPDLPSDACGEQVDVCVVGGGTAGVSAALQAGRAGARTLLVEQGSQVGGNMTSGGVNFPGLFHAWGRQVIAGAGWDLVTNAVATAGGTLPDFSKPTGRQHWRHQIVVNVPVWVALAEEALGKAGVDLRYHSAPVAVRRGTDGTWILTVAMLGELRDIRARQIVDCTGNGAVAALAGAERLRGEKTAPGSFWYTLSYPSPPTKEQTRAAAQAFKAAVASGKLQSTDARWGFGNPFRTGAQLGNYVDAADNSTAELRTDTTRRGRASMLRLYRFLRRQPGYEGVQISAMAAETGVRETYRVKGRYVMTHADYVEGRMFPDAVCHAFYPIDLHDTASGIHPKHLAEGTVANVPLRALQVAGCDGLWVAGRCMSSDRLANSALRVEATCMATGQAAGEAAALAAVRGVAADAIPLDELKRRLRASGAIVPEGN